MRRRREVEEDPYEVDWYELMRRRRAAPPLFRRSARNILWILWYAGLSPDVAPA